MTPRPSFNKWLQLVGNRIEGVLLDIDGVLLSRGKRLPGSRALINHMYKSGTPYWLLTNDGNHSPAEKARRLGKAGLSISQEHIISCGHVLTPLARSLDLTGKLFFVMGDTGSPCYAQAAELNITRKLKRLPQCHGVILGEENYDWESTINAAVNFFIDHPKAPLIILNPDEYYPGPKLTLQVAAGGIGRFMTRVLEAYGISIDPVYLGKPHTPMFDIALNRLNQQQEVQVVPENILMVGDNLNADIAGGKAAGLTTALMLTGVTSTAALRQTAEENLPDMVFEAL